MKILLSAIQPSNKLTLGNYLGAIKPFIYLQKKYKSYIFVADLHVITNPLINFKELNKNKRDVVAIYQASGLDLKKAHVFYQSDVLAHTALAHIIACNSTIGELNRMTQFKDKAKKNALANGTQMIPFGLLYYPILMAADILLYSADIVPVGSDQTQHMELTRNLAQRMNNKYGKMFKLPETYITKSSARVMDLQNPSVKMSKSATSEKGVIFLFDKPEVIKNKIMAAKTDSLNAVKYDLVKQPGVSNLIDIYSALTGLKINDIEAKYKNRNYHDFKKDLADIAISEITKIQKKYATLMKNFDRKIQPILDANAKIVNKIANAKLNEVCKKIGIK